VVGVGLYSLLRAAAARRLQEIGLRMALGASRSHVAWLVCQDATVPVLAGLVVGMPAAFLIVRAVFPIATAVVFIATITAIAALAPARRTATIEPMQALRRE